jgi:hypothetical protein
LVVTALAAGRMPMPPAHFKGGSIVKMFVIRLESGEYLTSVRMTSGYIDYERTLHRMAASELNDFDSQLVLKRLKKLGQKTAVRQEIQPAWSSFSEGR